MLNLFLYLSQQIHGGSYKGKPETHTIKSRELQGTFEEARESTPQRAYNESSGTLDVFRKCCDKRVSDNVLFRCSK